MSDAPRKKPEPDEDLLEFLGGIDEVNDESRDDNFSEFLANTDIDKIAPPAKPATPAAPPKAEPPKEAKHE